MPPSQGQKSIYDLSQVPVSNKWEYHSPPSHPLYTPSTQLDAVLWPSFRTFRSNKDGQRTGIKLARLKGAKGDQSRAEIIDPYMSEIEALRVRLNNGCEDSIQTGWKAGITEIASRASKESDLSIMMCNSGSTFGEFVRTHPSITLDVREARKISTDDVRDNGTNVIEKPSSPKLDWADEEEEDPELWQSQVKSYLASGC